MGKTLVTQATLKPASAKPNAARRPAPPAPTTTASNEWSTIVYAGRVANVLFLSNEATKKVNIHLEKAVHTCKGPLTTN